MMSRILSRLGLIAAGVLAATAATAQQDVTGLEVKGAPSPGGTGFQVAATSLAEDIHWLDSFLLVIITAITLFVTALLAVVVVRYNRRANPEPAQFTHNSKIEVAWTIVPILILIVIGSFSLPILFNQLEIPEADVTVKATGYQWYWGYEYPDNDIEFDSYMLGAGYSEMNEAVRTELAEFGYDEEYWKLATDTAVVIPAGKVIRMQTTAGDVIHSWKIPSFGVHIDSIPGRLNETWFQVDEPGVYFGQCSELCGMYHAYMPITVKVVTPERYAEWVEASGGTLTAEQANWSDDVKLAEAK